MTTTRRWFWRGLDLVWLVLLSLYALAWVDQVPFHGDEATLIAMSGDYHLLVQEHDLDAVLYSSAPEDPAAQDLRLLNGTVGKMAMGLAWDLAGHTADELNQPWNWGVDDPSGTLDQWTFNETFGHIPVPGVLHAARVSSTALLLISLWAVFAIAWRAADQRGAAWLASAIYITTPEVLLNGRRAMMEGSLLCFLALLVLVGIELARAQARPNARPWTLAGWAVALGVAGGFAMASKHTALMVVLAVFLAVALAPAVRSPLGPRRFTWRALSDRAHWLRLIGAGVLMVLVFLLLNPLWWAEPWAMPARVLDARYHLLRGQANEFGRYEGVGDRVEALIANALYAKPQYFEDPDWQQWVGDEVAAYESTGYDGRENGLAWGIVLGAGLIAGLIALGRRWRTPGAWVALVWFVVTALAVLALTPLDWQRYYLPLQAPLAVVGGAGAGWAACVVWRAVLRLAGRHDSYQPV